MRSYAVRRRNLKFILLLIGGLLLLFLFSFPTLHGEKPSACSPAYSLQINEICTANTGLEVQDTILYEDYIELYNPTDEEISLENVYLSDNSDVLDLGALPKDTIEPDGYYLIYAAGTDTALPEGCISLPFHLADKETVFLSFREESENGTAHLSVVDSVYIPSLAAGAVYGRPKESASGFAQLRPSPGLSNSTAALVLEEPVFSLESGFYETELDLEIRQSGDTPIYYTLDGSIPTRDSLLYTGPIHLTKPDSQANVYSAQTDITTASIDYAAPEEPVDKAVIVRAASIDADGNYSNTVTGSYFIGFQGQECYQDIAVISLAADPDHLFSSENGIYVRGSSYEDSLEAGLITTDMSWSSLTEYLNYYWEDSASERLTHIDLFDENGLLSVNQDCGIRIRGNESRNFPQKSFTLFSRQRYGTDAFASVFFDTGISYSNLILNSGKNLKKVFFFTLAEDRDVSVQRYLPCQVFLNGEYWGMYYLMEKYSPEYLEGHYGTASEDALLIKATREVQAGNLEDISRFKALREFLTQDMSDPDLYEELLNQMDMQSFIDWMCTNIYIGNTDSKPLGSNVFTWQSLNSSDKEYNDGKWRWMLYDLDDSLCTGMDTDSTPAYAFDSFVDHPGYSPCGFLDDDPMPSLMGNESFREQFVLTFMDMANENFRADHVMELLDEIEARYTPWADKSYERWNTNPLDTAYSEQIEELRTFFANRFDAIVPCLAEHFSLTGELVTLSLSGSGPESGTVHLNTLTPDLSEGSWEGSYYTDYPVTLTAEAAENYEFSGWEISGVEIVSGDVSQTQIQVRLGEDGAVIKAVFAEAD